MMSALSISLKDYEQAPGGQGWGRTPDYKLRVATLKLIKDLLVHPYHEVTCDGISCSWDKDTNTCNCILSPVRGNGLFRIHQGLYLDENLQYEISPIAKIDQPFIFIGFQGEMSAFNFLSND